MALDPTGPGIGAIRREYSSVRAFLPGLCVACLPALPSAAADQSIDRPDGTRLRIVSYNIFRNSVFPTDAGKKSPVKSDRRENFARIAKLLNPDIWALQEARYGDTLQEVSTEKGIRDHMERVTGGKWHTSFGQPGQMILSRYPIKWAEAPCHRVQCALIDLPESVCRRPLLYFHVHLAPGGDAARRAGQARKIVEIIAKVRDGKHPQVPRDAMIVVGGDFNSGESSYPYRAITSLDTGVPEKVGAGEGAAKSGGQIMVDVAPTHFGTDLAQTHGSVKLSGEEPEFSGQRIDYVLFGPGEQELKVLNRYILDTLLVEGPLLEKHGLRREDVALQPTKPLGGSVAVDHLPIVVDLGVEKR